MYMKKIQILLTIHKHSNTNIQQLYKLHMDLSSKDIQQMAYQLTPFGIPILSMTY